MQNHLQKRRGDSRGKVKTRKEVGTRCKLLKRFDTDPKISPVRQIGKSLLFSSFHVIFDYHEWRLRREGPEEQDNHTIISFDLTNE